MQTDDVLKHGKRRRHEEQNRETVETGNGQAAGVEVKSAEISGIRHGNPASLGKHSQASG